MAKAKSSSSRSKKEPELPEQLETREASRKSQVDARANDATSLKGNKMSEASIIEYAVDLEQAEAPPLLPEGDYPAEIRGAEKKTSGQGNEYVNVTFIINADDYPADFTDGDPDGTIMSYGRLNPADTVKGRWGMKKFATAIGTTLGKKLDLNDWVGRSAIVSVKHGTYDGQPTANIAKVNPA